jgi:thymidine phosphorylase
VEVAGHLLVLAGHTKDLEDAKRYALKSMQDGSGYEKFKLLVQTQGGDQRLVEDPNLLPKACCIREYFSTESGYVAQIHAREIGLAAMALGAGRERKSDQIDHAVGIVLDKKVGELIEKGERLFTVHANDEIKCEEAINEVLAAHTFSDAQVEPLPLFYQTIKEEMGEGGK